MTIKGYIQGYDGQALTIVAPFSNDILLQRKGITDCEIRLNDGRRISNAQRRKIFAMVEEIAEYAGYLYKKSEQETREMLRRLQLAYIMDYADTEAVRKQLEYYYCELVDIDLFSLSNVDMSTARDFIDWLVELMVKYSIPTRDTLLNRCEDIQRYLYACVLNRRCAICGKKADIHEVDHVGMGRDREVIHHLRQRVEPLCRLHHGEAHDTGQDTFDKKYHLEPIRLDKTLCEVLGWRE